MKKRVLFVGVDNSARSQMAEAFLNAALPARFEAHSAGIEPGRQLNPMAVEVMREVGIDISNRESKSFFDLIECGEHFHYVITVGDETAPEHYPSLPRDTERMHWHLADPSSYQGPAEEKLAFMRHIRNMLRERIEHWSAKEDSSRGRSLTISEGTLVT